jgi:hypothetical protein
VLMSGEPELQSRGERIRGSLGVGTIAALAVVARQKTRRRPVPPTGGTGCAGAHRLAGDGGGLARRGWGPSSCRKVSRTQNIRFGGSRTRRAVQRWPWCRSAAGIVRLPWVRR